MSTRAINPYTGMVMMIPDPPGCSGLLRPLAGEVTQGFGVRSVTGTTHRGTDIANVTGTPVYACDWGTATFVYASGYDAPGLESDGSPGGYGNQVRLAHAWGESRYGHFSEVYVRTWQPVSRGQLIGRVGTTGISSGPHCHWETIDGNSWPFDPAPYIGAAPEPAPPEEVNELPKLSEQAQEFYEANLAEMKAWAAVLRDSGFNAGLDTSEGNDTFDKWVDKLARFIYAIGLPQAKIDALPDKVATLRALAIDTIDAGTIAGFPS